MIFAFLKGAFLGFSLVTPLGPQNAFIFNCASVEKKYFSILPVILTSAAADIFLVLTAILGVDLISSIPLLKPILSILGIGFLSYIGISTWKNSFSSKMNEEQMSLSLLKKMLYTLSISLLNPHALLDTFVVIGSVSSKYIGIEKQAFTIGCILMDLGWFIFLAALGFYLGKTKNSPQIIKITNRISAIIMLLIAFDMTLSFTLWS